MPSPDSGLLGLSALAPSFIVDRSISPGESNLVISGKRASATVTVLSIHGDLPSFMATFTERRRILRETADEVRDVVFVGTDVELFMSLELDGDVFDAAELTSVLLEYSNADESVTGTIDSGTSPAIFDLSVRRSVRGKIVNILRLVLSEATIADLFDIGLWDIDVYATDVDHPAGVLWGTIQIEVKSLFDGETTLSPSGSLTMTGYQVTVRYDRPVPDTGMAILTGYKPTILNMLQNQAGTGVLSISGNAPEVLSGWLRPSTATLSISGGTAWRSP